MAVPWAPCRKGRWKCQEHHCVPPIPPVNLTRMSRDHSVDLGCRNCNFIFFLPMPVVLEDHTALLNRRQSRAVLHWQLPWDAAWPPHCPPSSREDTHFPRCHLHSGLGLLPLSFQGSPPLHVHSCFLLIPGLFSKAQGGMLGIEIAQILLQTSVGMLSVPGQPLCLAQELFHPTAKESQLGQGSKDIRNF